MLKYITLFTICILLEGCPLYMDPPTARLQILNYTDAAVYVYHTCSDSLPCEEGLKLFLNVGSGSTDACGKKIKDTIAPNYRINAYSWGQIDVSGSPENPKIECKNNKLNLFFITESTMRKKTWDQICENQLFEKKIVVNQAELDSVCWRITYE